MNFENDLILLFQYCDAVKRIRQVGFETDKGSYKNSPGSQKTIVNKRLPVRFLKNAIFTIDFFEVAQFNLGGCIIGKKIENFYMIHSNSDKNESDLLVSDSPRNHLKNPFTHNHVKLPICETTKVSNCSVDVGF